MNNLDFSTFYMLSFLQDVFHLKSNKKSHISNQTELPVNVWSLTLGHLVVFLKILNSFMAKADDSWQIKWNLIDFLLLFIETKDKKQQMEAVRDSFTPGFIWVVILSRQWRFKQLKPTPKTHQRNIPSSTERSTRTQIFGLNVSGGTGEIRDGNGKWLETGLGTVESFQLVYTSI